MQKLGAIVGIWLGIVGNTRKGRSPGSTIALQFVGDDQERLLALTAQQFAKESLGCTLIAARLQQNIDDITVLIHGTETPSRVIPDANRRMNLAIRQGQAPVSPGPAPFLDSTPRCSTAAVR